MPKRKQPKYTCDVCGWVGDKGQAVVKLTDNAADLLCPECLQKDVQSKCRMHVPGTDEWLNKPRKCSRCDFKGRNKDFPITSARGKMVVRSWCFDCNKAYMDKRPKTRSK